MAIGKESVAVRIAELYAGIYSVKWGIDYAMKEGFVRIGLPRYMTVEIKEAKILGKSLDPREGGLYGEVPIEEENFEWQVYPNPIARTFMVFEVKT